jgi:hypothetical protein
MVLSIWTSFRANIARRVKPDTGRDCLVRPQHAAGDVLFLGADRVGIGGGGGGGELGVGLAGRSPVSGHGSGTTGLGRRVRPASVASSTRFDMHEFAS